MDYPQSYVTYRSHLVLRFRQLMQALYARIVSSGGGGRPRITVELGEPCSWADIAETWAAFGILLYASIIGRRGIDRRRLTALRVHIYDFQEINVGRGLRSMLIYLLSRNLCCRDIRFGLEHW